MMENGEKNVLNDGLDRSVNTKPNSEGSKKDKLSGEPMRLLFNRIAGRYDLLNRILSFGIDQRWRRIMFKKLKKRIHAGNIQDLMILDLATGTGDVAIGIKKRIRDAVIVGADLSEEMMRIAEEKVAKRRHNGISFVQANAASLPFENDSFSAVTIAFGIRNFRELDQAFREICRVLKPGGSLHVLEFAWPSNKLVSFFYSAYSKIVIPAAGKILAGDKAAYKYLTGSIKSFPNGKAITARMEDAGLAPATYLPLGAGIVHLYEAVKN